MKPPPCAGVFCCGGHQVRYTLGMLAVFGHTNPDTDAITSALVYASFLSRQGVQAQAYRLGELNFETAFVLRELGVDAPEMLPELPAGTATSPAAAARAMSVRCCSPSQEIRPTAS